MTNKPTKRMSKNATKTQDFVEFENPEDKNSENDSNKEKGLPYLGQKSEAPDWETDGYWIETNWRINYNTHEKAFKTLFMWHNETVNVWSHLLGCLFFTSLIFWVSIYLVPVFDFNQ